MPMGEDVDKCQMSGVFGPRFWKKEMKSALSVLICEQHAVEWCIAEEQQPLSRMHCIGKSHWLGIVPERVGRGMW